MSSNTVVASGRPAGLGLFLLWLLGLTAVRLLYGFLVVPPTLVLPLQLLSALVFVAGPIVALTQGTKPEWKTWPAAILFFAGALVHASCVVMVMNFFKEGPMTIVLEAVGNAGLLTWCLGLGILVGLLIKDKNMLLPVAFFLAGFDMFLVFSPEAPVARMMQQNPQILETVASDIPAPVQSPEVAGQSVSVMAYVGPADFFFSAVFLFCLYRFGMRVRETMKWLVISLTIYLILVLAPFGLTALPALVPIGLTVLLVNRREFQLSKEEKQATWGAGLIALALAGYGLYRKVTAPPLRPEPPAEPLIEEPLPEPSISGETLPPTQPD